MLVPMVLYICGIMVAQTRDYMQMLFYSNSYHDPTSHTQKVASHLQTVIQEVIPNEKKMFVFMTDREQPTDKRLV